jgi:hypothetical protein
LQQPSPALAPAPPQQASAGAGFAIGATAAAAAAGAGRAGGAADALPERLLRDGSKAAQLGAADGAFNALSSLSPPASSFATSVARKPSQHVLSRSTHQASHSMAHPRPFHDPEPVSERRRNWVLLL